MPSVKNDKVCDLIIMFEQGITFQLETRNMSNTKLSISLFVSKHFEFKSCCVGKLSV